MLAIIFACSPERAPPVPAAWVVEGTEEEEQAETEVKNVPSLATSADVLEALVACCCTHIGPLSQAKEKLVPTSTALLMLSPSTSLVQA